MFDLSQLAPYLQENAIGLKSIGINSYGWSREYILQVVEFCRSEKLVVLGGDIFDKKADGSFVHTYDSWFITEKGTRSWEDYVQMSCDYASERIAFFTDKFPDKELIYNLVTTTINDEITIQN